MANRPRLIRELVTTTISDQPDIEIVGEVEHDSELESLVESTQPDVLIVALDRTKELPRAYGEILQGHPHVRVIAISTGRDSSMFYWTSTHIESQTIETSESGVLTAIRSDGSLAERST